MIVVPRESDSPEAHRRFADEARALPNLQLLEPRPREELGELMNRAVAVVSTSTSEGMPNVFLEGWSRGVPALALSFDPDGMIERHGLGYSASGNLTMLAAQARELWRERDDPGDLPQRCIAYVRAEHWAEAIAGRWADTIEHVRAQ
jgi:glycosyltransferase involved in cell wall biosynthesis